MIRSLAVVMVLLVGAASYADTLSVTYDLEGFGASSGNVISDPIDFGVDVASIKSISVDLSHSWVGDLEFGLYAPTDDQSTATDIGDVEVNASYALATDQDSSANLGLGGADTGLLTNVGTYRFVMPGTTGVELGATGMDPIPPGSYDAETWGGGGSASGWRFVLTDDAGGDTGAIGTVTIDFNPVPEPAGLGALFLGLSGLLLGWRRR